MVRGQLVGSLVGAALAITLAPAISAAQPEIDVTPATSHNFGNQLVTAGATASFTFTIENTATGMSDDLDVASITKVGAQCGDFNLTAPATPFTIQQQSDQDIMVSFDPSVQGARACTIRIAGRPAQYNLLGAVCLRLLELTRLSRWIERRRASVCMTTCAGMSSSGRSAAGELIAAHSAGLLCGALAPESQRDRSISFTQI